MRKKKNKKLKKQFKQLMQQHLENQVRPDKISEPLQQKKSMPVASSVPTEEYQIHRFVKKDMKKTVILSTFIFLMIFGIYYYLNSTNSISKLSNFILKLIGAS